MRSDLTIAFSNAKNAASRKPRQLAVFHFLLAGDKYVSDQALGAADGLSHEYQALVEDWGELLDLAGGDPTDQQAGECRQLTLTIWNGGSIPFSDYFLKEDPENILVDIYQWFYDTAESDMALIDTLVVQDPIKLDETSRLLSLDLVSLIMRYDNAIGETLSADDWPDCAEADTGKGIDLIVGTPGEIKTLVGKTAPTATLSGSILADTLSVSVYEDLDDLNFPASGTLQIGDEKMTYSGRTASAFTISQRGAEGTTAAEHIDQDEIAGVISDYTFIVGKGPIQAINNVKIEGLPAPAIYTAYPALNPARIVFSEKPYVDKYAIGSTFLEMQFDSTETDDTSEQAYNAYDEAAAASYAIINKTKNRLSIKQATVNEDRGEIVKAYLTVEHYASGTFLNDYAEVSIASIGVLGRLSRPDAADATSVDVEVDIEHGHSHEVGGEHSHDISDPEIAVTDTGHSHASDGSTTTEYLPASPAMPQTLYAYIGSGGWITVAWSGVPAAWDNATLYIRSSQYGALLQRSAFMGYQNVDSGEVEIGLGPGTPNYGSQYRIILRAYGEGVVDGYVKIHEIKLSLTINSTVETASAAVEATTVASPDASSSSDKSVDDVDDYAGEADVDVDVESTVRTLVNIYDITSAVNFDWNWFTNQICRIDYKGSNDNKNIYILHVFFDIEYRKRETVFSDEIICEPTGLIDDGAGTYTGAPSALITRPGHVRKYILCNCGGMPAGYVDAASFADAGAWYAVNGYTFNGVLAAALTVKEVEKKLAWQARSRFFWSAGKARIAVRKKLENWSPARHITTSDTRLRSISIERQSIADIVNSIELFYNKDYNSAETGSAAFRSSTSGTVAASISRHGTRENPDLFLMDLVADSAMAADLVAFYLDLLSSPSSFYTLETYLSQFDLEKEDILQVSANFNKMKKVLMAVRAADRVFGSAKLGRINAVRIIAECLRYFLIEHTVSDTARIIESLSISLGLDLNQADFIDFIDELVSLMSIAAADTAAASDALSVIAQFRPAFSETITSSEQLAFTLALALTEQVIAHESFEIWRKSGFGSGGFGDEGFGGYIGFRNRQPDELQAYDELAVAILMGLGYQPADTYGFGQALFGSSQFGDWPDKIVPEDALYFSDGFGGPNFGQFGWAPFGS